MKEKIKTILKLLGFIILVLIIILLAMGWFGATLEYIAGEVSLKTILAFLFGVFIGILLTLFIEGWEKQNKAIRGAKLSDKKDL